MLIGIDIRPCSLSLRETGVCSITKLHQNKSHLKMFFIQKSIFVDIFFSFIPNRVMGINGGYFPAICRVCFLSESIPNSSCGLKVDLVRIRMENIFVNIELKSSVIISVEKQFK